MSKKFHNIKVPLDESLEDHLKWLSPNYQDFTILKKSVDARGHREPYLMYSVETFDPGETSVKNSYPVDKIRYNEDPLLIIGSGPAGLFAALRAVERGIPCHVFEQGSEAVKRMRGINRFWRYGELDPRNNVCFGEGGAGLYSDGKLITRIKSPYIPYVLQRLVQFGAPQEIEYLSNPHVGSDKLRRIIPPMRKAILEQGGEIHFDTKISELLTENNQVIGLKTEHGEVYRSSRVLLACGHSATDTLRHLKDIGVHLDGKSFALGLRIEHPQELINKIQYKQAWQHEKLEAANYKLAHHDKSTNTGVYSFCMCPGGYVLSSGTEANGLVCNGMSNFNRNSPFANSAIVVTVDHDKFFGPNNTWGGMDFREQIEKSAFQSIQTQGGTKQLPGQRVSDFIAGKPSRNLGKGSSPSGTLPVRIDKLLPHTLTENIKKGLEVFSRQMKSFEQGEALFYAVESRTSCPVRVTRDSESLQSISHQGLYPLGEGAGYAGGITSAACDGIKVVERIVSEVTSNSN